MSKPLATMPIDPHKLALRNAVTLGSLDQWCSHRPPFARRYAAGHQHQRKPDASCTV
jgi:hypothetical protein